MFNIKTEENTGGSRNLNERENKLAERIIRKWEI